MQLFIHFHDPLHWENDRSWKIQFIDYFHDYALCKCTKFQNAIFWPFSRPPPDLRKLSSIWKFNILKNFTTPPDIRKLTKFKKKFYHENPEEKNIWKFNLNHFDHFHDRYEISKHAQFSLNWADYQNLKIQIFHKFHDSRLEQLIEIWKWNLKTIFTTPVWLEKIVKI